MSRLPNAPLIEVIFEIRWRIQNNQDLQNSQYLHGDMYATLKDKYPVRESLVPPELPLEILIGKPVYRFRKKPDQYPLFQVGPGLLTLNTLDDEYYWHTFYNNSKEILESFNAVSSTEAINEINPILTYIDFFPFDFEKSNVIDYLNKNFNITYKQNFIESGHPKGLNIEFHYEIDQGNISIFFQKGKHNNGNGIVLKTKLNGPTLELEIKSLLNWLDQAHGFCSKTFEKLTEGPLYESFKYQK